MSRFTPADYQAKLDAGVLGVGNLIEELVDQENRNEELADALRAANVELVRLEGFCEGLRMGRTFGDTTKLLMDCVALVRWLALPWGPNDPLFPTTDQWTRQALAANVELKKTWFHVVRSQTIDDEGNLVGEQEGPTETPSSDLEEG